MKLFVSNNNESVRLFENRFLEYFTHMHPAQPVVLFGPVILYFGVKAALTLPFMGVGLSFIGGLMFWIFMEYGLHRFLFHYEAKSAFGKRMIFMLHGCHHDYPRDKTRLVMSPLVSIPLSVFFYFFFQMTFGIWQPAAFSGLVFGYLSYDLIHYASHHFSLKGKFFGGIKSSHLRHHYQDPTRAFGLSNPLGDYLFGTAFKVSNESFEEEKIPATDYSSGSPAP